MATATILGISAYYHDAAAALVRDGAIVAAAQEERFTRCKHDARFPARAIRYCLDAAGCDERDVDYVAFYEKPLRKAHRLLETHLAVAPRGMAGFSAALPLWLRRRLWIPREIRRRFPSVPAGRILFATHHESHAASAFFPSPFDEAAILTIDGVGEWQTTTLGIGRGNRVTLTHELMFPHSLGLLYSAFTYHCGFAVNSGEYKLMGLAPYGVPKYADVILERLMDLKPDGSFRLRMQFFDFCGGLTMTSRDFERVFGHARRVPEAPIEQPHMDMAASVQAVTEEVVLRMARTIHRETGMRFLTMAGGVALNCVANGRVLREGPFEDVWVQPAAGDAGGALGAALLVWHDVLGHPRRPSVPDAQQGSLLGPSASAADMRACTDAPGVQRRHAADDDELAEIVAELLANQLVVGWFQGRMEFGPRALGSRSILADPRSPRMQSLLNRKIKFREGFRPFAPAVLEEHASEWFDLPSYRTTPYMLSVAPLLAEHRVAASPYAPRVMADDPDLARRLSGVRSQVPAVTHVDYSARVQTVDRGRHPRFWKLLQAFHRRTGCPMLVNTSFNVRGEPIVCSPHDACTCFLATNMDALAIERLVLLKTSADPAAAALRREQHLAQFALD